MLKDETQPVRTKMQGVTNPLTGIHTYDVAWRPATEDAAFDSDQIVWLFEEI